MTDRVQKGRNLIHPERLRGYAARVGALRKATAIGLSLAMLAGGSALALASGGGSSHGHSGKHQYHAKSGCWPVKKARVAGKSARHRSPCWRPRGPYR